MDRCFFNIHGYIFEKVPGLSFELIQCMSSIREAESRCQNLAWQEYDAEFRTRQALKQEPWNKIYSDLWLKIMTNTYKLEKKLPFSPNLALLANQISLALHLVYVLIIIRANAISKVVDFLMFVWHVRGTILKINAPDIFKIYNRMRSLQIRTQK